MNNEWKDIQSLPYDGYFLIYSTTLGCLLVEVVNGKIKPPWYGADVTHWMYLPLPPKHGQLKRGKEL